MSDLVEVILQGADSAADRDAFGSSTETRRKDLPRACAGPDPSPLAAPDGRVTQTTTLEARNGKLRLKMPKIRGAARTTLAAEDRDNDLSGTCQELPKPPITLDQAVASETILVGGIPTVRASRRQLADMMVADSILARSGEMSRPKFLTSSNGSVIARFGRNAVFRDMILKADVVDADGQPLVIASRLFCKSPLRERVATTDFIHDAARAAVANGLRFYFLGAKPGVAQIAADRLRVLHPGLVVVGVRDGYFSVDEEPQICRDVLDQKADVLWVGLGSPTQEGFAIRNRDALAGLAWIKTCGGLFDHCSGQVRRSPRWMQRTGLEWLYRMIQEPARLGPRYLSTNIPALFHLCTATSSRAGASRKELTSRKARL